MLSLVNRAHKVLNTRYHQNMMAEAEKKRAYVLAMNSALQSWQNSALGTHFTKRLELDRQKALDALAKAKPTDINTITALQNQVAVIDKVNAYIAEIILSAESQN